MVKWITRNAETILIIVGGVLTLLYAASIPANKGRWTHGILFVVVALPSWCILVKAAIPLLLRMDAKFGAAKGSAKFLPLAGCVGAGVSLVWMLSIICTVAAFLGGPKFSHGICHYLTSFSWIHIVVGVGVTLPLLAAAGVCHAVRWRSHRKDNRACVQVPLSRWSWPPSCWWPARQALAPGIPNWQPLLGIVLVLLTALAFVFSAGRIFRVDHLMRRINAEGLQMFDPASSLTDARPI
jgi:hypothetical protein